MQINHNINSMAQLEKDLGKSAEALSKIGNTHKIPADEKVVTTNDTDLAQEMVKQIEIPIAYTANAEVISTQNSMHKTLLDIKV